MSALPSPALTFDLDGTLIDSVYQHVLAWHEALDEHGLFLAEWQIHRRIGVSKELARELQMEHAQIYAKYRSSDGPHPGATELLRYLREIGIPHAIATSRPRRTTRQFWLLRLALVYPSSQETRWSVLSLIRISFSLQRLSLRYQSSKDGCRRQHLGPPCRTSSGTSGYRSPFWRYRREELQQVGAYRVYQDPSDLLAHRTAD